VSFCSWLKQMLWGPPEPQEEEEEPVSERYAVLIGINDYTMYDPKGATNLRGCLNDVEDYRRLCLSMGFKPANIHILRDRAATAQNIFEEVEWLASKLNEDPNNEGVCQYSGHGTLYKQRPSLCSADMDWANPVTYKKLGDVLKIGDTQNLTVIMDCCHSGARLRNGNFGPFELWSDDVSNRFLAPPDEEAHNFTPEEPAPRRFDLEPAPDSYRHLSSEHDIVLTGCKLNQTSADAYIAGAYHGAFTYYLLRVLEGCQFANGGGDGYFRITYKEAIERLAATLRRGGYSQVPEYQGPPKYADLMMFKLPKG
jgi:metacaspase-1